MESNSAGPRNIGNFHELSTTVASVGGVNDNLASNILAHNANFVELLGKFECPPVLGNKHIFDVAFDVVISTAATKSRTFSPPSLQSIFSGAV